MIVTTPTHPFFIQTTRQVVHTSEGHVYAGPLSDGYWVDAADLLTGDRLLNYDGSWAEVVSSEVLAEPLRAYNLTVEGWHTYFVAANVDAAPVWVHNSCFDKINFNINRLPLGIRDNVSSTLAKINLGERIPGTKTFRNRVRTGQTHPDLPTHTLDGSPITYTEYRVPVRTGQAAGGTDRIVVGSDGRIYYTGTHYGTGENYNGGNPFGRIK